MTRLLRGCVACVRNSRSHTDNLRRVLPWLFVLVFAVAAEAQVQVDLKFKRLQYIAYEPVVATVAITNLAGRDIELHDANGQSWLGFEITGSEEQPIAPLSGANREAPLRIQARPESHPPDQSHAAVSRQRVRRLSCAHEHLLRGSGKIFLLCDPSLRSHGRAADLAANRWSSRRRGRIRRCAHVFVDDQSFSRPHFFVRAGAEQRHGRRLCHLLVRPDDLFRATAGGNRSRQSIACFALRGSARLVVCPHRTER